LREIVTYVEAFSDLTLPQYLALKRYYVQETCGGGFVEAEKHEDGSYVINEDGTVHLEPAYRPHFAVNFTSGTVPETIVLGVPYTGPSSLLDPAEYDAGDGVWRDYDSNTIQMRGNYIMFRGDWRTSVGTYNSIFYDTFAGAGYECETCGTLDFAAVAASAHNSTFRNCPSIKVLRDNPFQPIVGAPAASMFLNTFLGCTGLPSLPAWTLDTSGLTGAPAVNMFFATFYGCTSLADLPAGTLDTSGLTGTPATSMFQSTFNGCDLQSTDFTIGAGITLTDANISTGNPLTSMFLNNANWTGELDWGGDVIHTVLTPTADINTFTGCTSMPDFATIDANWK
jgi:hypothetical protein